jgi:hypothetical protein
MATRHQLEFEEMFRFANSFLTYVEANKVWVINTGLYINTCGYTGPGMAVLLNLFVSHGIHDMATLDAYLATLYTGPGASHNFNLQLLVNMVNETIGNFLDISVGRCPITNVDHGISGLAQQEMDRMAPDAMDTDIPSRFYPIAAGGMNLVDGVNLISFTGRSTHHTFHHAVLYIIRSENVCYIMDSWSTPQGVPFDSRGMEIRRYDLDEVIRRIDLLNQTTNVRDIIYIMAHYFKSHSSFNDRMIRSPGAISVNTIDPAYISVVFAQATKDVLSGKPTGFGRKKRNHATKKYRKNGLKKIKRSKPKKSYKKQ